MCNFVLSLNQQQKVIEMDTTATDKAFEIMNYANELNLANTRLISSCYGKVNSINVRISDHLPKLKNLRDYKETLIKHDDGNIYLVMLVVSDQIDEDDLFDSKEEIEKDLRDELDANVVVEILNFEEIDECTKAYFNRALNNITK